MYKILFVCTGNICRSPTAHGVLRHYVQTAGLATQIEVDSAGTHSYHVGESPDPRAIATARTRGVDIADLIARQVTTQDFTDFDLILAMDNGHYHTLNRKLPGNGTSEIDLFLRHANIENTLEVPDPYYSDQQAFDHVLELCQRGAKKLLEKLQHDQLSHHAD